MTKKLLQWAMAAALICGTSVFTACTNDDNPAVGPDLNVAEKIIGKWIIAESDGKAMPTNEKVVYNFISTTKAYVSLSFQERKWAPWNDREEALVDIVDNHVTLTQSRGAGKTVVVELDVQVLTNSTMVAKRTVTLRQDGGLVSSEEDIFRCEKLDVDYSANIIGTWEGQVTSEQDTYGDGLLHRWEYKADGTYVYYIKDGDNWVPSDNTLNQYFVDGNLLCMRWINTETEYREWWEIESIEDGVMKWKALRQDTDGNTFTATFEMKKVN